jgi:hypothetical protein
MHTQVATQRTNNTTLVKQLRFRVDRCELKAFLENLDHNAFKVKRLGLMPCERARNLKHFLLLRHYSKRSTEV